MRLLPKLVTTPEQALPLADSTASELVVGLLCTDAASREKHFAAALTQDPALTLWAVCRAFRRENAKNLAIGPLAEWLAAVAVAELHWPAKQIDAPDPPPPTIEAWADLAARSRGIATLAADIAERSQVDRNAAYILGLLHATPQWLAPFADAEARPVDPSSLPAWLKDELDAIWRSPTDELKLPADCVARAVAIAATNDPPGTLAQDFGFDAAAYAAQLAQWRDQWLQETGAGERLQYLVGQLARLASLEHDFQRALETEKLESLKQLAYGAGHEINNPLANISARAQTLLHDERDPERRRKLAAINSQAFRAYEMIADMMLFARPPRPKLAPVDLVSLLTGLVAELAAMAQEQGTELVFHPPDSAVTISADKTQIVLAVRALCVNALEALTGGGRVDVTLQVIAPPGSQPSDISQAGESVQITVTDNGPGIPPETRRHIFDPFYSGREAGRGLGFGLSKCWRIVTSHGGLVEVTSENRGGATFTIVLPVGDSL